MSCYTLLISSIDWQVILTAYECWSPTYCVFMAREWWFCPCLV